MSRMDQIEKKAWAALRPPAKLRLSEWTERNVYLPATLAAAPGLMRLFPYQREMADAMSDPAIERVTVLKSARVGYTQLTVAALAHFAANDPSAVLAVLPTESDARHMMTGIIEPTFQESPDLRDLLTADTTGRDTMLSRHFPGGNLALVSASSPRNLRARTARVLIMDELDGWEIDARGEGDPVALAEKRTFTFSDRKIIAGSTPVDEETSRICRLYAQSDQRVWECPCPHCGEFHELVWKDIRWDADRPDTAAWACPSCGSITEDADKAPMVLAGRWRVTRPGVTGHAGFKINALASLLANAAWPKLAAEFLEAKKSPITLKPFVNTILGEPWRDDGADGLDGLEWAKLQRPFSTATLPEDAAAITAGLDFQGDRAECTFLAWTPDGDLRVLGHEIIWGDPTGPDLWFDLDTLLKRQFPHPLGGFLTIGAAILDSGNWADQVYDFGRPRMIRRVIAAKGMSGFSRPKLAWGNSRKTKLAILGVDALKLEIHHRLKSGNTILFSEDLGPDYFEQLNAERLVTRYTRGQPQRQWQAVPGRRNEAFDCLGYAIAARQLLPGELNLERARTGLPPARPAVARSQWLSSG